MKVKVFRPAFCVCVFFAAVLVIFVSSVWVPMTSFGVPFEFRSIHAPVVQSGWVNKTTVYTTELDESTAETGTASSTQKRILLWTGFFGELHWIPNLKKLGCLVHNCQITTDQTLFSISDAVIFHWEDVDPEKLPEIWRPNGQLWILFNEESPPHTKRHKLVSMLENKLNLFVSYRKELDYFAPYGLIEKAPENGWKLNRKKLARKQKMVAWMVSNCDTSSHRETYVKELKEFINVDIYGACGDKTCLPRRSPSCFDMIERDYKFYLSFENSICKDYVTEKLFQILQYDVIPVVLGGANYSALLPPNSYIDALNFTSPKNLAGFLHYVAGNANIYESFLTWKQNFVVKGTWLQWVCGLCKDLNDDEKRMAHSNSFYNTSLVYWWYAESRCTNWEKLVMVR